jgi:cobyrinic acid a,c-diamide synthase
MPSLPRLAIGTIQDGADLQAVLMALLDTLRQGGVQPQCFASRSSLPGQWGSKAVTGLPGRFLDSWLMSPELCCDLLLRAAGGADLAAVVGEFDSQPKGIAGGSLDTLCQWLDLPRLAVVDVALIDQQGLPNRPNADAVLLDHASRRRCLAGMITDIETLWGLPVVGALGNVEGARQELARLAPGTEVPLDLCRHLNEEFQQHWQPERFAHLVDRAAPLDVRLPQWIHDLPVRKPTVAVAYDEAFFGYFPSTLDQLELLGAQVVDFSPLRDESLPPETEIVYLGCGRPEAFARALSENHCMKSAIRSHVSSGGRIYGEVGGAAYLSQMMETPSGEMQRMCGILPAIARLQTGDNTTIPTEITVNQENWLAPQGTRLRGYRSGHWRFEALGCRLGTSQKTCCHRDLVGCNCVVGSMIHFHFAAFPEVLQSFFQPSRSSAPLLDPWQSAS